MQNLTRKIVVSLILALVVFGGLAFYADAPRLFQALGRFDWRYLPLALAATLVNYMVRFGRWHYYLHILGIRDVRPRNSLLIFLGGFSLTLTPGKLGEVLKSLFLKNRYGTPISYSASIVIAERLTDVLGMLTLAAVGLVFYPIGLGVLLVVLVGTALFVLVVQQRALAQQLLDRLSRLPAVGRFANMAENLYESAYLVLRLRPLLVGIGTATASWLGECVAFYFVLLGIGLEPTPILLLQAIFIYAASSLFGALTMLPGGLGATEAGMALLLQEITAVAREQAVAAALVVRLCTLWFAVLLGVIAVLILGVSELKPERSAKAAVPNHLKSTDG